MRLLVGLVAVFSSYLVMSFDSAARAQDAAEGEKIFKRICSACHIPTAEGPHKLGPSLYKVIGRKSGGLEGYKYSNAKRPPDLVWTPETLDPYLTNPRGFLPGTTMAFAGLKNEADRKNVIAYLQTLK